MICSQKPLASLGQGGDNTRTGAPGDDDDDAGECKVPVALKDPKQVSADSLQSPHDPDVTYSGHKGKGPFEQSIRGFVALGLGVCLILIVVGLAIAGATAGVENPHPMLNKVYVGFSGTGLIPGMFLFFVYMVRYTAVPARGMR